MARRVQPADPCAMVVARTSVRIAPADAAGRVGAGGRRAAAPEEWYAVRIARPSDLDGVLDALASHPGATLLAGGTDVMVEVNLAHRRPDAVVSLRHVSELRERDRTFLGAATTWAALVTDAPPALAELARTVGSPQIRAAGTIGGNLGTASPAGDALPFLAAADARVVLASTRGVRELDLLAFLVGPKRTARAADEVILGVRLPDVWDTPQAAAKLGPRQAMAIAVASCCVLRDGDGRVRVALGSVGPTVLRVPDAEALLDGDGSPSLDVVAAVEQAVRDGIAPIDDHRATAAYRRHAAGVLVGRTLQRVLRCS
jgi:CO/xanthine dehydrogenase FAD-binding subunit